MTNFSARAVDILGNFVHGIYTSSDKSNAISILCEVSSKVRLSVKPYVKPFGKVVTHAAAAPVPDPFPNPRNGRSQIRCDFW